MVRIGKALSVIRFPTMTEVAPISAPQFISAARALVGVPWRHQGRTRDGVDCIGILALATKNAGLDLLGLQKAFGVVDTANYSRQSKGELLEMTARNAERIAEPIAGSALLFRWPHDRHPQHFGIYTDKKSFIHADARNGRVAEVTFGGVWTRLLHSIWLVPGVIYDSPPRSINRVVNEATSEGNS